jgi:predicted transcriptional regulator
MMDAYNFIGSWQLFPEKGNYENGNRPKSGNYKIEAGSEKKQLVISANWVTLENQAFSFEYKLVADGNEVPAEDKEFADAIKGQFINSLCFEIIFMQSGEKVLSVLHELQPNGYLKITQTGIDKAGNPYINTEIYHKQMSVVPYATAASGAVIKPTQEGVIRHKALSAMEEQTNMQFEQIRRQIELLAIQAQAIQMRKELSMMIYNAKLNFVPVIGQTYYLYQRKDDTHLLSLISPKEYGGGAGPYKNFVAPVKLLADHTWMEV